MTVATAKPDAFRIDVAEAEALIAAVMPDFGGESVALAAAAGQILHQTITAERDQPPFDRATMDGIAVAAAALTNDLRQLRIAGVQAAGQAAQTLSSVDECFEVMTGAVMPTGTDAVIPVERITVNKGIAALETGYQANAGQFVHRRASDHAQGDLLLEPGTFINGPVMAVLTAAGSARVEIARQPRIAIVSTGDELVDVGTAIADFQIRSSNDRAIETCLHQRGFLNTVRNHLPDDPDALRRHIGELHEQNDLLILSGGVSMGKYDYVPAILDELGVRVVFHKILQRPGLPMWFGVSEAGKPVFALPGNPVSTIVCCVRYILPALMRVAGVRDPAPSTALLTEAVDFKPDLSWFLPVKIAISTAGLQLATPRPTNTSGDFIGLRDTDGFVELTRGRDHYPAGFAANLYRW
jgi:molybdopterin molybdotransferase